MSHSVLKRKRYHHEALLRYAKVLGFGDIHTKLDKQSGLHAIVAIHSDDLGPAIGGCRLNHYASHGMAMLDALRLAHMMTLKAAASGLDHGGGKAVIIAPKKIHNREQFFTKYGDFVHELNGRYITACDVGTTTDDMDIIAQRTPYVIGAAKMHEFDSNPGKHTARGVFLGMQAAIEFQLKRSGFDGVKVAVQGAGSVGYFLTQMLVEQGAVVSVADPDSTATQRLQDEFNINVVSVEKIYDVDCDIFSPCALGGTISAVSLERIGASIIAGSANNQLSHQRLANLIQKQGKLYAPDFLINAGGLINAAVVHDYQDPGMADRKIDQLHSILFKLFEQSAVSGRSTLDMALQMAQDRLEQARVKNAKPIAAVCEEKL